MKIIFNGDEVGTEQVLAPVGVPVGFEILTAEPKESQRTGRPMLEVKMVITGDGEGAGDQLYDYFVEPESNKRTQVELNRLARAVGLHIGASGFDSEELIGLTGSFVLKAETYEGRERRRISAYILEDETEGEPTA